MLFLVEQCAPPRTTKKCNQFGFPFHSPARREDRSRSMYSWWVFALYVLAFYGSLAKAFVCVVKPMSAAKEYDSHPAATCRQERLKCTPLRMALSGRGVDSVGGKQPLQKV